VPTSGAANGRAWRHSEISFLCNIVLAAGAAQVQVSAHILSE